MKPEHAKIARSSLLLSNAPPQLVDAVLAKSTVLDVPQGTTIFAQDDPADAIFIVIRGWVKLYRIAHSGAEAVVGVFTKGHSFGEAVALKAAHYPVFAEAVTDCTLVKVDAGTFLKLLMDSPEGVVAMLTATYAHLHRLVAQIEQLKAQTAPQRVAEFLLDLSQSEVGPCTVDLPYDKVLIAGHLGMKPESLSRAFSRLREHGVTVGQASAQIEDVEELRHYAKRDRAEAWHRS